MIDFSKLCIHTQTTKPWSIEECIINFASAGVKGISIWRHLLEGKDLNKIKSLPRSTLIYCAHEYTKSNILFALSLDPENKKLLNKKNEVENLLRDGKFTIPFNLGKEKKLNPFLNSDNKNFQKM